MGVSTILAGDGDGLRVGECRENADSRASWINHQPNPTKSRRKTAGRKVLEDGPFTVDLTGPGAASRGEITRTCPRALLGSLLQEVPKGN